MESQQNPTNAQQPQAHANQFDMDLYSQITAEDTPTEVEKPTRKSQSPFMMMVIAFMKVTFWMDGFQRAHETLFRLLSGIWAGVMTLLYVSGLITLVLSVFSWMRLPLYLQDYFESHNLQYDILKMADFSLSKINVVNLRDADNTYSVPFVRIQSTFADFLNNKIRVIEADGLQINFQSDDQANMAQLDSVLKLLRAFSDPKGAGLDVSINSVKIDNSVLNLMLQGRKIPVAFSLSGIYSSESQVVIPFYINEDFLRLDASLSVQGPTEQRQYNVHINSGSITLPDRPPEELSGEFSWTTQNNQVSQASANLTFNYGYSLKNINLLMEKSVTGFDGRLKLQYLNTANRGAGDKPLADVIIEFKSLQWPKLTEISTDQPLTLSVRRLVQDSTVIEGLDTVLQGKLDCSLQKRICHYTVQQEGKIHLQNILFTYKDQQIVLNDMDEFRLLPSSNSLILSMQDPPIQMNLNMAELNMAGYINSVNKAMNLSAQTVRLNGSFSQKPLQTHLLFNVTNGHYSTADLSMEQLDLMAKDIFDETAPVQFKAETVKTTSQLLKKPVSVDMTFLDRQASMQIKLKDSDVTFLLDGVFKPFQGTFSGQFNMAPVQLENLPFALSDISNIFPTDIQKVTGLISAGGQMNFYGPSNVAGPLFVGLKDINFEVHNSQIQGLNGVLALQSVLPLVSAQNQSLSIQNIQSIVPVSNIKLDFQLGNQAMRLSGVTANVANQPVSMGGALIPFRNPSALLYLKTNEQFDMTNLAPYLNINSLSIVGGKGSLSMPLELGNGQIRLPSLTLKMNNVTLEKKSGTDVLGLFKKGNSGFMVRNGQFVASPDTIQVDLDGWLMPKRQKDSFTNNVPFKKPLFKQSKLRPIPKEVTDRQYYLFQNPQSKGAHE